MELHQFYMVSLLYLAVLVTGGASEFSSSEMYSNMTSVRFKASETVMAAESYVYHMEFDLYRDNTSILFADTTRIKRTYWKEAIVASSFRSVYGFKQLNSSHIAVADNSGHCIKIFDRANQSVELLAGTCGSSGFVDGASARFYGPNSIELNVRNPGHLLISDRYNDALRSVEIASGNVSTVTRLGFDDPQGIAWYNGRLLVCNTNYISEVVWGSFGTVINRKLTTTATNGYKDGDFSIAQFYYPSEIAQLREGLFLVADTSNLKLRLLNMFTRKVLPVCVSSTPVCNSSTSFPARINSLLISNDVVYVGGYQKIFKLTGSSLPPIPNLKSDICSSLNQTVYIYPNQTSAMVSLPNDGVAHLPAGEYKYEWPLKSGLCTFHIIVKEFSIVQRAAFTAKYDVTCTSLNDGITKSFLQSVLVQRRMTFQTRCGEACQMSAKIKPWYECENNLLKVIWPTDDVFSPGAPDVPEIYRNAVAKLLNAPPAYNPELSIITHVPPLVQPKKNSKGESVQIVQVYSCAGKTMTNKPNFESCV